jgi:crotonobetainyl-CoA:carnitine CoA-transferase CaiB-like acyl-CoA transferase
MSKPLAGLRILDLSQVQQGPQGTGLLQDLGAEIIKVEDPDRPDASRVAGRMSPADSYGTMFYVCNRGKRDIALNLKTAEAREVIYKLAARCDVVASNFRPGVMEALEIGYEDLRRVNPKIVYVEAYGLGSRGSKSGLPVYDIVGQAASGLMSVTGEQGHPPMPVGAFIGDAGGATMFAFAILAGITARDVSGQSQRVEVSELGTLIFFQAWEMAYFLQKGSLPFPRAGRSHTIVHNTHVWGVYDTADSYIVVASLGRKTSWRDLCTALGLNGLESDTRFMDEAARAKHNLELIDVLQSTFRRRTTEEWLRILSPLDVYCYSVPSYREVVEDAQVLENGYVVAVEHPQLGKIRTIGCPVKFGGECMEIAPTAPELGQHTEEILRELGYSWEAIVSLRERGAIGD